MHHRLRKCIFKWQNSEEAHEREANRGWRINCLNFAGGNWQYWSSLLTPVAGCYSSWWVLLPQFSSRFFNFCKSFTIVEEYKIIDLLWSTIFSVAQIIDAFLVVMLTVNRVQRVCLTSLIEVWAIIHYASSIPTSDQDINRLDSRGLGLKIWSSPCGMACVARQLREISWVASEKKHCSTIRRVAFVNHIAWYCELWLKSFKSSNVFSVQTSRAIE